MKDQPVTPDGITTEEPERAIAGTLRSLRVWPALILSVALVCLRYGPGLIEGGGAKYFMIAAFGPLICCLLILIWWLAASRATWKERCYGFLGLIACVVFGFLVVDPTLHGPGIMFIVMPLGLILFVVGLSILRHQPPFKRTGIALVLALSGCCLPGLLRNEGMTGDYAMVLHWRWTPTPEELMLANRTAPAPPSKSDVDDVETAKVFLEPEWPGFRGEGRDGRQTGPVIATTWDRSPPEQLWKIAVGPGWGSFAVAGNFLFTQEQRGPMECVVCYDANTGREIWVQQTEARFDDPMGGPGPRTTPTLKDGKLFATGATGNLVRLDPATGAVIWKLDLQKVAGRKPPMWGFTASPLVAGSVVIVHAGGEGDKGILAFDIENGDPAWSAPSGDHSYSSPQLNRIAGEESVLMLSNSGVDLIDPRSGKMRLRYEWLIGDYRALQPKVVGEDVVLLPTGSNKGTRAIRIKNVDGKYSAEELWTSRNMKPDFSDFIVIEGHAYGFDGGIFASINLETGDRNWEGGRYGKGQVLLLENSRLLLVAAENGAAVLLKADPDEEVALHSFKALEGKTWNHPVVVGDRLYIRNAQEAACHRLPLAETRETEVSGQ